MIEEIKKLINEFRTEYADEVEEIYRVSKQLQESCGKIERSWSGSFAGWHGKMYFHNFQVPSIHERFSGEWGDIDGIPDGWEEKQPEEVRAKIEELMGDDFSVNKFEDDIKKLHEKANRFKEEVIISFSSFDFDKIITKEKDLLDQIEKFNFGKTKGEFIYERLPKTVRSRDTEALGQGIYVASWLCYKGIALEGKSSCEAVKNFLDMAESLVRRIEKKKVGNQVSTVPNQLRDLHHEIYSKCHELYEKGVYAEAVEKGFKVVRDRLRKLTGYEKGADAFGKGKLHIKGAAAHNVDQDFNDAVKFLTMAIDRFRNEKSHTSDAKIDDPVRAYEYLRLSSLAMNLLENAEIESLEVKSAKCSFS